MKLVKLPDKCRAWLGDRFRSLLSLDTILVLKKDVSAVPDRGEFALTVFDRYDPAIIDIYRSTGGEISEGRVRARFAHRLKFYQLTRGEDTVARTWLVPPPRRFIDEAGYHFPVPETASWIRDIFVSPKYRGRRIFSVLLDVLINRALTSEREIWSDTAARNQSSVKAHLNAGFRIVDTLKILRLNKLLLVRLRRPARLNILEGFRPGRRVIVVGRSYREYKNRYLA